MDGNQRKYAMYQRKKRWKIGNTLIPPSYLWAAIAPHKIALQTLNGYDTISL